MSLPNTQEVAVVCHSLVIQRGRRPSKHVNYGDVGLWSPRRAKHRFYQVVCASNLR